MREPVSTITNLAYLLAGVMLWHAWFTPVLILLAVTSAGYHWTKDYEWRRADVHSMLLLLSLSLLHVWQVPLVFALFITAILILTDLNRTATVVGWFVLVVAGTAVHGGNFGFTVPLLIGGVCNVPFLWLTWNRTLTDAIHGVWHIATATGIYMLLS